MDGLGRDFVSSWRLFRFGKCFREMFDERERKLWNKRGRLVEGTSERLAFKRLLLWGVNVWGIPFRAQHLAVGWTLRSSKDPEEGWISDFEQTVFQPFSHPWCFLLFIYLKLEWSPERAPLCRLLWHLGTHHLVRFGVSIFIKDLEWAYELPCIHSIPFGGRRWRGSRSVTLRVCPFNISLFLFEPSLEL